MVIINYILKAERYSAICTTVNIYWCQVKKSMHYTSNGRPVCGDVNGNLNLGSDQEWPSLAGAQAEAAIHLST